MPRAVAYTRVPLIVCLRDTLCCGEYRDFYLTDKRRGSCGTLFFFALSRLFISISVPPWIFEIFWIFFRIGFWALVRQSFIFIIRVIEEDFWGSLTRWNMNFFLNDRLVKKFVFLFNVGYCIVSSLGKEFRISIVFNGICLITCKLFF